ncbi:unnamed protein product [Euphydryas editha]|uniref:Uncharacterized protein n=1 Tax=Euphydryas editha TaxID=104508 RepID=A0AAU9UBS9_EUPED|nr:unnamed protein product [Euphydryas editha]
MRSRRRRGSAAAVSSVECTACSSSSVALSARVRSVRAASPRLAQAHPHRLQPPTVLWVRGRVRAVAVAAHLKIPQSFCCC